MIFKYYEINKINTDLQKLILLYGKNEWLKKDTIKKILKNIDELLTYDEKDILNNEVNFIENLMSDSLFTNRKGIVVKRASDKILKIIENIDHKKLGNVTIIINTENLEKKSKLRNFFEKEKNFVCVAFYPDTEQTLSKIAHDFLKLKNISISSENLNLLINKCGEDRENLLSELSKIEFYIKNGKKISKETIIKLTNIAENYSISELIDSYLVKNKKKIIYILNENNFNNEDCILITRTLLNKSKKLLKLSSEFEKNNNLDYTISSAKPPIFWKDKEIIKQQIHKWNSKDIKQLIYKIGEIELLIKKNINNSINLITNFILNEAPLSTNNMI